MFGIGISHILLVAVIGLIFIGPEELPAVLRSLAKVLGQLKRATDDLAGAWNSVSEQTKSSMNEERHEIKKQIQEPTAETNGIATDPSIRAAETKAPMFPISTASIGFVKHPQNPEPVIEFGPTEEDLAANQLSLDLDAPTATLEHRLSQHTGDLHYPADDFDKDLNGGRQ